MVIAAFRNWNRQLRPTGDAPRVGRARLRRGIEIGLALVLLIQIARLVWVFLASPTLSTAGPVTAPEAAAPDYSIFQRFDAFFRTGAPGALGASTAVALPGLPPVINMVKVEELDLELSPLLARRERERERERERGPREDAPVEAF